MRRQPGLEAQLANIADEIAYNNHDVDDGLRAGLLTEEELSQTDLFRDNYERVCAAGHRADRRAIIHETVRGMINEVVTDLIEHTQQHLDEAQPADIESVRAQSTALVMLSPAAEARHRALKRFLFGSLYQHERVQAMSQRAHQIVSGLFEHYMSDIHAMPGDHVRRAEEWSEQSGETGRARAVADYVAGMTDRYAYSAYRRLINADIDEPLMG